MAVPVHPEDPAPDQPQTPPPVRDFLQAARYGDLEDVQRLLAQGTSVSSQDVQGRTALHMASANGHLDVVKCLIEHGAVSTSPLSEVKKLLRDMVLKEMCLSFLRFKSK
uniref:Uncharacterized protein n=1 Tax=Physcomitrium patens TaxID=3218 RepID=A0A7I4FKK2_PHYPA